MIQIEKFIKISDEKYDIYAAYHTENRWFGNDKMVLYAMDKETKERHLMLVDLKDGTREILKEIRLPKIMELTYYTVWEEKIVYTDGEKVGILDLNTRENEIIYSLNLTEEEREIIYTDKNVKAREMVYYNLENLLSMPHITNDGKFVSVFQIYKNYDSAEANGYIPDKYSNLIVIDVEKKEVRYKYKKVFPGTMWKANHLAINPEKPDLIAFAHEGDSSYVTNRIWFYDDTLKKAWNGVRQEMTEDMDLADHVGHEMWAYNGKGMYYIKYRHSVPPTGIGYFNLETGENKVLYSKYKYWHVCPSVDERFLLGDTMPHPNVGDSQILLVDQQDGSEILVDTVKETGLHPSHAHPQMSPDNSKFSYTYLDKNGNLGIKIAYLREH